MKTKTWMQNSLLVGSLSLSLGASFARADIQVIAIPTESAGVRQVESLATNPLVKKNSLKNVFSAPEKKTLIRLGDSKLAESKSFRVQDAQSLKVLQEWAKKYSLKMTLEENVKAEVKSLDPYTREQWGLHNIGKSEAYPVDDLTSVYVQGKVGEDIGSLSAPAERSDRVIKVAVLDTGFDITHPDLKGQVVEDAAECKALEEFEKCLKQDSKLTAPQLQEQCQLKFGNEDRDGDGYPMDCSGWNLTGEGLAKEVTGNPFVYDNVGHGTHVSGVIAALKNKMGVEGVSQTSKILPVKVIKDEEDAPINPDSSGNNNTTGSGKKRIATSDLVAKGLLYAVSQKAQVINISLGWPFKANSELIGKTIKAIMQESPKPLVVAAAGNDSTSTLVFPCSYRDVICVAAHSPDGSIAEFSNFGGGVDIAAPGLNILSTWPIPEDPELMIPARFTEKRGWEFKNGTSMATPFVAGALARLLNAGYSPEESYARLILGARPHQKSSYRSSELSPKFTLSGNADLTRSFKVAPQPLVMSQHAWPIQLVWDRPNNTIPFTIAIRNEWKAASKVTIEAELVEQHDSTQPLKEAHLTQSRWTLQNVGTGQAESLSTSMVISDARINGEIFVRLKIQADGHAPRIQAVHAQISVPLNKSTQNPLAKRFAIKGDLKDLGFPRTFDSNDGVFSRDYLLQKNKGEDYTLHLLREVTKTSSYELFGPAQLKAKGVLGDFSRVDVNQDGQSDYYLLFQRQGTKEKPGLGWDFYFFNHEMKPMTEFNLSFHSRASPLPFEGLGWLRVKGKLVPSWVRPGFVPELEQPKYDPWNPEPDPERKRRFYYLTAEGPRSLTPPKDFEFVEMVRPTPEQLKKGEIAVLLSKGEGHFTEIFYATVKELELSTPIPLQLMDQRRLAGLMNTDIVSIRDFRHEGTGLVGFSGQSAMAVNTLLNRGQNAVHATRKVEGPHKYDLVQRIAGLMSDGETTYAYAQSSYDLHFFNLKTGERAITTLKRFSFLPGAVFDKTFYPIGVEVNGERRAGLVVPGAIVSTLAMEVMTPKFEAGRLTGLYRPAAFRLESAEQISDAAQDCEELETLPASKNLPGQAVFFCTNEFIRVPLKLE